MHATKGVVSLRQGMCKVPDTEQGLNYYSYITSFTLSASRILPSWSKDGSGIWSVRSHVQTNFATPCDWEVVGRGEERFGTS